MGRLPNRPTSELGTGAGLPEHLRPKPVADPMGILSKPFKVPIKAFGTDGARKSERKRPRVSYALMDIDSNSLNDDMVDEDGNISRKVKGATLSRRFIGSADNTAAILTKRFILPRSSGKENDVFMRPPPPALGTRRTPTVAPRPLHDPMSELAIVLYDPTVDKIPEIELLKEEESEKVKEEEKPAEPEVVETAPKRKVHKSLNEILGISHDYSVSKKYPNVAVVIDPKLAKILRPHQILGVKFLYQCTSGMIDARAKGCIMADEMGLGKTLQCVALMWTLLKQGPLGKKTIDKSIIVCPSSLVKNWANEFDKWLGKGTLTPLAIDGKSTKGTDVATSIRQWALAAGRNIVRPVLIISYETLRRNVDNLMNTEIGLIVADEGHRLKNGESQTFTALSALNCVRRVILSGTPIQNDLSEYFSLLNFANPGLLGTKLDFRKTYELPILRGRDSLADENERKKGDEKLLELTQVVSRFIIRRTNDILSKYLPVKYEYVIFCKMAPMQERLYNHFITSPDIKKLLRGVGSQPLKAIGLLKKLCNHPDLLNLPEDIDGCEDLIPEDYTKTSGRNREVQTWHSGKMEILQRFLYQINRTTDDKIVLISNYTQTLDLIEKMCRQARYGCLRLDGTMNISKRQKLVDRFNDPEGKEFVFLLSSKAGGCGINLIGANRLVLIDPDWNPASDQQALARVWRDGQKKNCFIYRFITTGTIEEKILQRQSAKLQLSSCVVDSNEDVERLFSGETLKKLFLYQKNTASDTHDTYNCKRCGKDGRQHIKSSAMLYGDPTTWNHIHPEKLSENEDVLLANESNFDNISYCFQYISH
ncbi:unnamed protein product [Kuraishia capsulata CBS 1993]|uniref:DNA repair and recombination protein RAD54 n=1 Tax=Kuraishia capsulata CBS 1993 TaxID=1382522 RepID=W6MUK1_9ASCO|nr:uncharacterized protein KUCA_T00005335001 [Kuraishia capsulata CBS 1993]CDK29347.1 unnamed protein product [Kuraishia capsulata CBS 1993]